MIWQLRQNNLEDLYELKNDDEVRLFSESEIENYIHQNSNQLYLKRSLPTHEKQ